MVKAKEKICLITYKDDLDGAEIMETLVSHQKEVMEKFGIASEKKIGDILFVFKNLSGAIYSPRTMYIDQWEKTEHEAGVGRVSLVFHPMYMEELAIREYLSGILEEEIQPVIIAHETTVAERKIKSDTSTVERRFFGVRQVVEEIAGEQYLLYAEFKLKDLVKI